MNVLASPESQTEEMADAQALFEEARRRRRKRWMWAIGVIIVALLAALAVAAGMGGGRGRGGIGLRRASGASAGSGGQVQQRGGSTPRLSARPDGQSPSPYNQRQAERLAERLAEQAILPPGSTQTKGVPTGANPAMRHVTSGYGRTNVASSTTYWSTPLSPLETWQWVTSHAESGATLGDQNAPFTGATTTCASGHVKAEQTVIFPQPYPNGQAGLVVDVAACGVGDRTPVTITALVTWQPPRPADSYISRGVRSVTVAVMSRSPSKGVLRGPYVVSPVTVTTPHKVNALVAFVNRLATTVGVESCPAQEGTTTLILAFRFSVSHAPTTALVKSQNRCLNGEVLYVGGRPVVALADSSNGKTVDQIVHALTGVSY